MVGRCRWRFERGRERNKERKKERKKEKERERKKRERERKKERWASGFWEEQHRIEMNGQK